MIVPLASLRRRALNVHLHDSFALGNVPAEAAGEGRLVFLRVEDAEAYLRYWAAESGAMIELRRALWRREPGAAPSAFSNQRIFGALARMMVNGTLVVMESRIDVPRAAGESAVQSTAASAAPAAPSIPVSIVTPEVPAVPALDALEDVQIEGAQVLPEVLQTIEQIDVTMDQINLATVSLEPAPSGVPAIGTAMAGASSSITSTLGDL